MVIDPAIAGKRILILGGGLWHREYARRARQLGAEVWVTDWSPNAVARQDADHFLPIDLRDREATLALGRHARIDAVVTAADIGVPTAAHVSQALGLPGQTSSSAVEATNKFAMRRRASEGGLLCPWYVQVTTASAAHDSFAGRAFPVIVKPVDSCSSRGVQVVTAAPELVPAVERALAASLSGAAILEQFIVGREGSIEALVQHGELTILGVCAKTKSSLPDRYDLELRYPGDYAPTLQSRIRNFAERLVRAFNLRDAMLHIEFLVAEPDDEIILIEFALRGCGSKVVTHLLPEITGIDIVRAVLRQALGLTTDLRATRALHGVLHFLMFPPGRVRAIHGLDEARSLPGVIDVTVECGPGDRLGPVRDGRSRPGHLLACAPSAREVQSIVQQVERLVRVEYDD